MTYGVDVLNVLCLVINDSARLIQCIVQASLNVIPLPCFCHLVTPLEAIIRLVKFDCDIGAADADMHHVKLCSCQDSLSV